MPALVVSFTVVALLVGGQALFLDVLRLGVMIAIGASMLGVASRWSDGSFVGTMDAGTASHVDLPGGRVRSRRA